MTKQITDYVNEILTEDELRKMRDAIANGINLAYDDAIKNGNANMEISQARGSYPTLASRLDETDDKQRQTTAQLALKANQAFVDSQLSAIVSGAPKGTYTDLAALQNAYPNGADGVFLVLENGHWYYWNSSISEWTDGGVYQSTSVGTGAISNSMTGYNVFSNNYPFDDKANLNGNVLSSLQIKKAFIDIQIADSDITKDYYFSRIMKNFVAGGNLTNQIVIKDVATGDTLASYVNTNYVPTTNIETITFGTVKIIIDWSQIPDGSIWDFANPEDSKINKKCQLKEIDYNEITSYENSPFALAQPPTITSSILDIRIVTKNPALLQERFAVRYLWKNAGGRWLLTINKQVGTTWVQFWAWDKTGYTPTSNVEKIRSIVDDDTYIEWVIDWSKLNDGQQIGTYSELKKERVILENSKHLYFRGNTDDNDVINAITYAYVNAKDYQRLKNNTYEVRYMWKNAGTGKQTYVRLGSIIDGVDNDNYADIMRTNTDVNLKEVLTLKDVVISIDWSKFPDGKQWNGRLQINDKYNFADASITDTLPTDGYAIKDNTKKVISVDAMGNGDYTTIAEAYASIEDSSISNQYEVAIFPGTYNENNLIPPKYTHTHGLKPNTVVVTSKGFENSLPVFDQQYGSSKLSNMKIESHTGYCIHFDIGLDAETLMNENLHLVKKATYAGSPATIGGGSFNNGTLFYWKSCIFEGGDPSCHTNMNAMFENVHLVYDNCKLINCSLSLGNVGGFGHCVCEIKGLDTAKGKTSLGGWNSALRNVDLPNTYFANTVEWQIIGGNNTNFLPSIASTGEGLEFETVNLGESVQLSGSAVDVLFGNVNYKKGGARLKGRALGIYMVRDTQAGLAPYSTPTDVYQMWKRLGDCSVTNKTLSVTVDGVTETYTFDKNYLTLKTPESDIISEVNSVITNAILKKNVVTEAWENINTSEKQYVTVTDTNDILKGEFVTSDGLRCSENSPIDQVYGIALEPGADTEQIQVWVGNVFRIILPDGEYGIGSDGKLSTSATVKIGKIKSNILNRY